METDKCSCANILNRLRVAEDEIESLKQMPVGKGGSRTKRAPSQYNLHMKSCLKEEKGDIKERFKICVDKWKHKKGGS